MTVVETYPRTGLFILRQGFMAAYIPLPLPAISGSDAAGTVGALGAGVAGLAVGDRVVADLPHTGRGAHAEYAVALATAVAKLPGASSFAQGVALVKGGLMGRQTVDDLEVRAGDRVLISGGLGSVGRVAIQHLLELGARPVAEVRPERLEEARALAGEAQDITVRPEIPTFDLAISTAAPVSAELIAHVRDGGRVAGIVPVPEGANSGDRVRVLELYHRTDRATLDAVLAAAASGRLVVAISRVFPLDRVADAHDVVAAGTPGKVVLEHRGDARPIVTGCRTRLSRRSSP